jgi:hypothetical protein
LSRSDWIALIAAAGTLIGLVPAFGQYLASKRRRTKRKSPAPVELPSPPTDDKAEKPTPAYMKALACTSMAFVLFVIELVIFTWIAHLFGVAADFDTMTLPWRMGFVAIFLIPGLLLFVAFLHIMSVMED